MSSFFLPIFPLQILAVLCSLIGVVLLAYYEGFTNPDWESAVMVICGAMATAVYQVSAPRGICIFFRTLRIIVAKILGLE